MKTSPGFTESEDDGRSEDTVKEKCTDIEENMNRMREAKRWRSSEEFKKVGNEVVQIVMHLQWQMQAERGPNAEL
jgi:hypothetical protein